MISHVCAPSFEDKNMLRPVFGAEKGLSMHYLHDRVDFGHSPTLLLFACVNVCVYCFRCGSNGRTVNFALIFHRLYLSEKQAEEAAGKGWTGNRRPQSPPNTTAE